jgi:hypothetical protein
MFEPQSEFSSIAAKRVRSQKQEVESKIPKQQKNEGREN